MADYERACPELAASLNGHLARVWADEPGRLWLEVIRDDALADVVPARPIPATDAVDQVTVGVREDGGPWVLRLLGTHVFVAGVQGAGKGSVIWSVLRGLARPIHTGVVQVWAVDPKGGMELAFGRPLFTRFACETTAAMVELLEDAVTVMDARCARLAGVTRMHQPTVDEPLVLVIVDELSTLTAYEPDTKLRNRATAAISALLARGRAAAVVVLAAAQDPRKEVVSSARCSPRRSRCGWTRRARSTWSSATACTRWAPWRTGSRPAGPASATSPWRASGNRSGSAPPTSPTSRSTPRPWTTPPRPRRCCRRWR